jgi:glycine cleavage system protein P-like pyridoxal-binding family
VINNKVMETIIVHPKNNEEQKVIKAFLEALKIKFENTKNKSERTSDSILPKQTDYDPEFVASMERSIQDAKEGKVSRIKLDDIWK